MSYIQLFLKIFLKKLATQSWADLRSTSLSTLCQTRNSTARGRRQSRRSTRKAQIIGNTFKLLFSALGYTEACFKKILF